MGFYLSIQSSHTQIILTVTDGDGATGTAEITLTVSQSISLSIHTPIGVQKGQITIQYSLTGTEGSTFRVTYGHQGIGQAHLATLKSTNNGKIEGNKLRDLTPGTHSFVWDSAADLPGEYNTTVQVTMSFVDPDSGNIPWSERTGYFTVNNTTMANITVSYRPSRFTLGEITNSTLTLQETNGVGVDLTQLIMRFYDQNGKLVFEEISDIRFDSDSRVEAGEKLSLIRVAADDEFFEQYGAGRLVSTLKGIDDNGINVSASATLIIERENPTEKANISVSISPSRVTFGESTIESTLITTTINESNGVGVDLTQLIVSAYDQNGKFLVEEIESKRSVESFFGSSRVEQVLEKVLKF